MENINSSAVVTYNNKNFNDGQFFLPSNNQVNVINRNSDLKNGYHDDEIEAKSGVNLCCIAVNNSDKVGADVRSAKVSNGVELKYVSIIDVNSSPDLVTVDSSVSECFNSVYTNGDSVLKRAQIQDLGNAESEDSSGIEHCLGSKESGGLVGVQQFLLAENGFKVLNSGPNLQESQGYSGSESILVTESGCNGSKDILGSQHLLKAESDHQKLHQTNSGTSDEDTSFNQKFSNHMNSLSSSSGYETDPNVSIVEVNTSATDEIMKPATNSVKVSRYEVEDRDLVIKKEGLVMADDDDEEDEDDESSQTKSSRNDGDSSKTNGNSGRNGNAMSKTNGRSQSHDDEEDVSKMNGDSLMNYDDIDEAMLKSNKDSSKEEEDDEDEVEDDKSKSKVSSLGNDGEESKSTGKSAGKTRGSSEESMDVDEESSRSAANDEVANFARNLDAASSAICGTSNSNGASSAVKGRNGADLDDDDEDDDDSCLDGYSSNDIDEDDVDAKKDSRQPNKPQLKRTRSNAGATDYWNEEGEDGCIVEFLDKSNDCAEARLAAKRQARAEAREIRMRELERQQREAEETADKVYDIYSTPDAVQRSSRVAAAIATPRSATGLLSSNHRGADRENNSYHSSRRSSEDSLEEATSLRDMRHELKEVEDKFRKAMIANAQLDNEKAAAAYQVELLKDRLEEMDENHSQLNREHRDKCRQFEALKRAATKLQEDLEFTRAQLEERDRLIEEQGLVIVGGEYSSSGEDDEQTDCGKQQRKPPKRALVSAQVAEVLEKVGSGSLDVRLKKFVEQRNELLDELNRVKLELEEERTRNRGGAGANRRLANGPLTADGPCSGLDDLEEVQREANKLISDYKFRLQKADQDNSTLQATVARLESQVVRYKTAAEVAEKVEDDLKAEKRKLQREYRESQARVEELETAHSHLQKRLDKLKNAKSALLKEL